MKRAGNLYRQILSLENLELAFWKASRGKSFKKDVCAFREHLHEELQRLSESLKAGTTVVGDYHYFTVYDPKERRICAASFRERVLHHAILNVCETVFERYQIFDSYACRKGKGVDLCLARARSFCGKYEYFLKLDVHKYFDSVNHQILKALLHKRFKDKRLLSLFEKIIDSYHCGNIPGFGLPIGNLTSQFFANLLLGEFDHFVKEQLKIKAYLRYMDDMLVFGHTKKDLKILRERLSEFLRERLGLTFNKTQLNLGTAGIPFLGYRIFPDKMRLTPRSKRRFCQKIKTVLKTKNAERTLSLLSFVFRAETFSLRKKVLE